MDNSSSDEKDSSKTISSENGPLSVRILVPDGGELEEPEQEEGESEDAEMEEEEDTESEAEESETEEDEGDSEEEEAEDEEAEEEEAESEEREEAEGEEEKEDERSEKIAEEGTRLLHLNLDGLFLDLLGLEVDLDEVTLNLTASPGEGKLLGNLLSAVGGLMDGGGLTDLLGLGDGDGEGDSLLSGLMPDFPSLNPMERARNLASAIAGRIREMGSDLIKSLPLEDMFKTFLEQLVNQLLDSGNGNGDGEEEAAAA